MRTDLFDFDLPPELIAQAPGQPARRGAAAAGRRRTTGAKPSMRDLPEPAAARRPAGAQRHPRAADPLLRPARRGAGRGHPGRADRRRRLVGAGPARQAAAAGRPRSSWRRASWPRSRARTGRAGCGSASTLRGEALLAAIRAHGAMPLPPYIRRERGGDAARPARLPDRCSPAATVRSRHPRPRSTSPHRAARAAGRRAASSAASSRCMSAPAPSRRSRSRTPPAPSCTPNGARCPRPRPPPSPRPAPRGGRIVAVGTTVLRTLETRRRPPTAVLAPGAGETRLFVTPGYRFRVVDLPADQLPPAAQHAVHAGRRLRRARADQGGLRSRRAPQRFRFFSYGDACLIDRAEAAAELRLRAPGAATVPRAAAASPPPSARSRRRPSCRSAPPPRSRR